MASDNKSLLRFSVEESIWFQKGQEVEELYSLSLDPNVTVQDMDQYVVIKGELYLAGEYKREPSNYTIEDESFSFVSPKTISSFEERANGLFEFQHSFPVDITIPANRISSLDDVSVTISTFDYSMPERNCLTLCAELMISGIYGEQQNAPEKGTAFGYEPEEELLFRADPGENNAFDAGNRDPYYYKSSIFSPSDSDLYIPFEAEAKKLPEEENVFPKVSARKLRYEEAVSETVESFDDTVADLSLHSYETSPESPLLSEENREPGLYSGEESPVSAFYAEDQGTDYTPLAKEDEYYRETELEVQAEFHRAAEEEVQDDFRRVSEEEFQREPAEIEPFTEQVEEEESQIVSEYNQHEQLDRNETQKVLSFQKLKQESNESEERKRSTSSQDKEVPAAANTKQNVSLTDFFGRKEEQGHTKVKVCLVQQGDTLNSLASRYDINANAILALNELDSASEITEGQVLYIPSKQVSQKR